MAAFNSSARNTCPKCRCKTIRRSHRIGLIERVLLSAFCVRPYRCLDCDNRFYRYDSAFLATPPKHSVVRR